ncbi:hypothetical protein AVEN_96017-1 [Araneus ventricosus]|uniref:Uncharacterized protein n=1 Tax=Araneus ventricosus TaxID=182803 RepID=A0A4Y2B4N9_ARAVE|nr:hypothetical protein AVEN_96017-1 [Araneus ventricosus]
MVVTEILPSDTYRISQLEPSNGRPYATITHVSQLKSWKCWNEDDDDFSKNSDYEPEMQRPKRIVRKPVRYGALCNFVFHFIMNVFFFFCFCVDIVTM